MLEIFALWQEHYTNYLESAVDDSDPIVFTFAQWFAMRRHILEYPRRREYIWLTPRSQSEDKEEPVSS
jgi:hypothetical protein